MIQRTQKQTLDLGRIVVNGLVAGIGSGLVMAALLAAFTLLGLTDNPANALFAGSPLAAALLQHLAVAGVYGIIFTLGVGLLKQRMTGGVFILIGGVLYGCVLGLVARFMVFPGAQIALGGVPFWVLLVAHTFYGAALGGFTRLAESDELAR